MEWIRRRIGCEWSRFCFRESEVGLRGWVGFFDEGGLTGDGFCDELAVVEKHGETPAEDHAEGEEIKDGSGLLDGDVSVEVAAGEESDGGEDDDDHEEGAGALHHDAVSVAVKPGGGVEGPGEECGSEQEGGAGPEPGDVADGKEEHDKACGHASRGDEDFPEGDGGTAFANAPEDDDDGSEERGNGVVGGGDVYGGHVVLGAAGGAAADVGKWVGGELALPRLTKG